MDWESNEVSWNQYNMNTKQMEFAYENLEPTTDSYLGFYIRSGQSSWLFEIQFVVKQGFIYDRGYWRSNKKREVGLVYYRLNGVKY